MLTGVRDGGASRLVVAKSRISFAHPCLMLVNGLQRSSWVACISGKQVLVLHGLIRVREGQRFNRKRPSKALVLLAPIDVPNAVAAGGKSHSSGKFAMIAQQRALFRIRQPALQFVQCADLSELVLCGEPV